MDLLLGQLRLSNLNEIVSELLCQAFPTPFWVVAEIASISSAGPSGHTYLDLVEKRGDEVVAQARANIWRTRRDVIARFERVTRRRLERGMQVLLHAVPTFHPRYGYSLQIHDIDPNFTLGDMARRRQEVIDRLIAEELLDRNKELPLSPAPQRIAAITSATAAGWDDFQARLNGNSAGYQFCIDLFPALVQGDGAEASILSALARIGRSHSRYDCVVVMRGGGGTVDLSCFEGYALARAIAEFPLPVICGIGHERDVAVCDLVAHHAAATPTAAAEFLIGRMRAFETDLDGCASSLVRCARVLLTEEGGVVDRLALRVSSTAAACVRSRNDELHQLARRTGSTVRTGAARSEAELAGLAARVELFPGMRLREHHLQVAQLHRELKGTLERSLERLATDLLLLERDVRSRDPAQVLRRGYSITRVRGRKLTDAGELTPGDRIETTLFNGRIESVVQAAELNP